MDRFQGLDDAVPTALRRAPAAEKAQLELAVRLPGLQGARARVADRLRVRVVTWDPLGWADDEGGPVAAVEGSGSAYSDHPLPRRLDAGGTPHGQRGRRDHRAGRLGRPGGRGERGVPDQRGLVVRLEEEGLVPPLLGALRLDDDLPPAEVGLVRDWWPIDVATVAMVVAGAFGPVDLDLAPRALSAGPKPVPGCPACAGSRYSVPFELDLARPAMCPRHRTEALDVMMKETSRAGDDNSEAWEAFCHAAAGHLPVPHVPYPVRNRLLDAEGGVGAFDDDDGLLVEQAEALLEFAEWARTPDRFEAAMWDLGWRPFDGPARDDGRFDDFARDVAYRLGAARQFPLAGRLVDALVQVIPHAAADLHGELATQLAEAGRVDEARSHLQLALDSPPRVTEELSARLLERLGAPAMVELTASVAFANLTARSNTALGIEAQRFSKACTLPLARRSAGYATSA